MSEQKGTYMTLHGPDGSGETTVGRRLVATFQSHGVSAVFLDDWRIQEGRRSPFSSISARERAKEDNGSYLAAQLAKIAFDSQDINELNDQGIIVVKDRGVWDVRANLASRGVHPATLRSPDIREPDYSVALTLTEGTRLERLRTKNDVNDQDSIPNVPGTIIYNREQYLLAEFALRPNALILPTDTMNADQVTDIIYNWMWARQEGADHYEADALPVF